MVHPSWGWNIRVIYIFCFETSGCLRKKRRKNVRIHLRLKPSNLQCFEVKKNRLGFPWKSSRPRKSIGSWHDWWNKPLLKQWFLLIQEIVMLQCYSLKRKNTKNANIVFVSIVLLPPLVAAFNSAGFSNCLRASNMRLQRSEKQHLFLCSFKIFWKSERHRKTPWQTARSCRKYATTTVSALRIASSTVAVAEFNLLGSVLLNAEWMFFWASFPECAFFLGGNLLSFLWLFLEDPKTSTCEKA